MHATSHAIGLAKVRRLLVGKRDEAERPREAPRDATGELKERGGAGAVVVGAGRLLLNRSERPRARSQWRAPRRRSPPRRWRSERRSPQGLERGLEPRLAKLGLDEALRGRELHGMVEVSLLGKARLHERAQASGGGALCVGERRERAPRASTGNGTIWNQTTARGAPTKRRSETRTTDAIPPSARGLSHGPVSHGPTLRQIPEGSGVFAGTLPEWDWWIPHRGTGPGT